MRPIRFGQRTAGVVLVSVLCVAYFAQGQEVRRPWQDTYDRLAKSDKPEHRRMVAAWDRLIGVQNWVSAEGGQRIRARVLDYDEQRDSVVLEVQTGTRDGAQVRVEMVTAGQLNRAGQTRVKQIRDALARMKKAAELLPPLDGAAVNVAGDADPAAATQPAIDPKKTRPPVPNGQFYHNVPWFPDDQKWRTSYDEFRKQLSAKKDASGKWVLNFGTITPLRELWESEQRLFNAKGAQRRGEITQQDLAAIEKQEVLKQHSIPMGDVVWEGPMTMRGLKEGTIGFFNFNNLDVPQLPEPFHLRFTLPASEANESVVIYQGEPVMVRFIGTIRVPGRTEMDGPVIDVLLRFPDDQPQGSARRPAATREAVEAK